MNWTNRRFLVTGAAGFIGSHLVEALLEKGAGVLGVDCFTDYYDPALNRENLSGVRGEPGFELRRENLLETPLEEVLPGVDGVFHQAAQAGVRSSWGEEFQEYLTQNIHATQHLLEAMKQHAPRTPTVLASSSSVYGAPEELPMTEKSRTRPFSPYGVTKLAAEHLGMLYHRNFDLPLVALRYFTVYGPRQRPDMAFTRFFTWIYRDQPITVYGDGEQTRDFTYVSDIVSANLSAYASDVRGRVMNVGGGQNASVNDILERMETITGRGVRRESAPSQAGDVPHTEADTRAIREELDWTPEVSLREGLGRQWEWICRTPLVREVVE